MKKAEQKKRVAQLYCATLVSADLKGAGSDILYGSETLSLSELAYCVVRSERTHNAAD